MTLNLIAALLIVALVLVNAGWLLLWDRRDTRDRAERAELHQRFQNPHVAVAEHHAAVAPPRPAQESQMPMSDEHVAQEQERNRLIAWIEQRENGGGPAAELFNGGQPVDGVAP